MEQSLELLPRMITSVVDHIEDDQAIKVYEGIFSVEKNGFTTLS